MNSKELMDKFENEQTNHLATKDRLEKEKALLKAIEIQFGTETSNANLMKIQLEQLTRNYDDLRKESDFQVANIKSVSSNIFLNLALN